MHQLAVHPNVVELLGVCNLPSEHEVCAWGRVMLLDVL